ncbi:hypothetical protein PUN28_003336 [Cardiocondyla obscurior]|uniref:Gustatory receptor n=4 Tax=Cardiocondyla obscurior TaxID=286306 RepID=A0AAW2GNB3_9HYME
MFSASLKLRGRAKYKIWKNWQLFHATDFKSLMNPCFIFCSVLGMFPYKINGSTFTISKWRYILSTFIICVLCTYELVVLYEIDFLRIIKFKGVPKTLERNCFYLLNGFIAVITFIKSGPRMRLLQTIMNISSKLPVSSYQKLSKFIHIKDILGFLFLTGQAIVYYLNLDFDTWHKAFVPYVILLVFQMDMLYVNCACILKACFKRLDDNLKNLQEVIVNDEPHLLRRIYHKHRNPFLLKELKTLKKQHLAISDTLQMLNMVFSLQLLATIILTFAEITFNLYFYIMHIRIGVLMSNLSHEMYDMFLMVYISYYSLKIMLIIWVCETGKDQAMQIGITVHDLLNNTSNEQIQNQLQLFSLQILNRENAFSAKGLVIDGTLFISVNKSVD